jgi:GNAT superfamily N-acetyltransferase
VQKRLLDELLANAWRPMVVEAFGGWRYRWANGVTRRANSALAVDTDVALSDLVERAEAFYAERGAPTMIQVSTVSAPHDLVPHLHARGYRPTARTLVHMALSRLVIYGTAPGFDVELTDAPTDGWLDAYWSVESNRGRTRDDIAVCQEFLLNPGLPAAFAAAHDGDEVMGVGQIVFERGWGGVQCMATGVAHRRRGVASAVLHALAEEAHRRGVMQMYLAVMAGNDGAEALYERAGFRPAHEYMYLTDRPRLP